MNPSMHAGQLRYRIVRKTLVIDLGAIHRVLSSAPRGGGLIRSRTILNHQVGATGGPKTKSGVRSERPQAGRDDPASYLGRVASELNVTSPLVALMTAVPMSRLVVRREESDGLWVQCFCTVGVTNAVTAGEPASSAHAHGKTGTINIILVTNAILSLPAMVGAVQVITESKTATLMGRMVPSAKADSLATGTGTDAVVIASRLRDGPRMPYSGTHTQIGAMIGRVVGRCVQDGLARAGEWTMRHQKPVAKKQSWLQKR